MTLSTSGVLNVLGNLQENSTNLSSKYLQLSGGTLTGQVIQTGTNPAFYFGGGGGASFGQASTNGAFSTSALNGDCVVRSQPSYQLILQSGTNSGAIIINSANNINMNGILTLNSTSALYLTNSTYLLGLATSSGQYSTSASSNDVVLRGGNTANLILQTGSGSGAIIINSANLVGINSAPIANYSFMVIMEYNTQEQIYLYLL